MGVSKLKKDIRSIKRFLSKTDLTDEVRKCQDLKLSQLEKELEASLAQSSSETTPEEINPIQKQQDLEKKMMLRYKHVMFFEQKKVFRKIKKALKLLDRDDSKISKKELTKTIEELYIDYNYIMHFPKTSKYISLYPNSDADSEKTQQKRTTLRNEIREKMKKGQMEKVHPKLLANLGRKKAVGENAEGESSDDGLDKGKEKVVQQKASGKQGAGQKKTAGGAKKAKKGTKKVLKAEKADVKTDDFFKSS